MTDERWDEPSERLKQIAAAVSYFRECLRCPHRHPKGERCGYPKQHLDSGVCECTS